MKRTGSLIIILFIVCSCSNTITEFEEFTVFENQSWNKFRILTFDFNISDTDAEYNIWLVVRYNNNFPEEKLHINTELVAANGEQRLREVSFRLFDADKKITGKEKLDYFEIKYPLYQELVFNEKGMQKTEIQNMMGKFELPGIEEIGIVVESK